MRSAAWALSLLFPVWAVATEKYILWNSQTCEEQIEDGISFSRYTTYNNAIDCFDFADNVVAGSVSQSKDTLCQVFSGVGCSGEEVQLVCTANNLFDPRLCCTDTPQGIKSARCWDQE
ncbi:uncharacterized protein TRIVIDRAFT_29260 [Trichoderma virens Gv29-8]|uniref:Hydrophobin n=1 Tax=Hypocrea virens (strain Gv29-8 / FGSC 10586) TaxID=413071 RepID=G9MR88_HYPVG|nr:uncharacterized protein TRIVIDRAFT_29260 [Trichoderma virens Gv29-8]EHK23202.1 hypothetical protein TRIVIDRAFT_29260 [Trichoderma virens Gv29-8]UKZ47662.1 hypothetical protein TrVGV298_001886 [Trichoderma virens]